MKYKDRQLVDWQQQVWDAKEKVYQETKGKSFQEYLANIRQGAKAFRTEGGQSSAKRQGAGDRG